MKNIFLSVTLVAAAIFVLASCHSHDHPHDENGGHSHSHGDHSHDDHGHSEPEIATLSFTERTNDNELFVEFEPLTKGVSTSFAAHYSDMYTFKPVAKGKLEVQILDNGKVIKSSKVDQPASSGIFRPVITPDKSGKYILRFLLTSKDAKDTIDLTDVVVYENQEAAIVANPPSGEDSNEITYLKEQAWKVDFAIQQAKEGTIQDIINTGGEFRSLKGEERLVSAKRSGIVTFKNSKIQEGKNVRSGESLFSISSEGLIENNLNEKIQVAKAELEQAEKDFERAEKLLTDQIIGSKEYQRRKSSYQVAQSKYNNLIGHNNGSVSLSLTAPMTGVIKNIMVNDGQFVKEGDPLILITQNKTVQLLAEVPLQYQNELYNIESAKFKTPTTSESQSISNFNGKLVSIGKTVDSNTGYIPVVFDLENKGNIIAGSFAEVFLITKEQQEGIVIPRAALMKDYSSHYVYVQTGGESFEKREVTLGIDDGSDVQILSGLREGDWVVTKGAYQIKMASMSNSIPAHGHSH